MSILFPQIPPVTSTISPGVTAAGISLAAIPGTSFRTTGYAAAGDGGDAIYVRGASGGLGAVQDAAGQWWNIPTTGPVTARSLGCKFDGATNDGPALRTALTAAATFGLDLVLPPGNALITDGKIGLNGTSIGTGKIFRIRGAGRALTTITRGANYSTNTVLEFDNFAAGFELADFTVDGGYASFTGSALSSIVIYETSYASVSRVGVKGFRNTGILLYQASTSNTDCNSYDCVADGGGVADAGILIANMPRSNIVNGRTYNILGTNPGYGLQLKNACQFASIQGGYAENCIAGTAFGSDTAGVGVVDSKIEGVVVRNCQQALSAGYAQRCSVDLPIVDMADNSNAGRMIDLGNCVGLDVTVRIAKNILSAAAYMRAGTFDCRVVINTINNDQGFGSIAAFLSGGDRNLVQVRRFSLPTSVPAVNTLFSNAASTFTGSTSGTTLTVTAVSAGILTIGAAIPLASAGTTILSQTSGTTGGVGVYTVSVSQTLTSQALSSIGAGNVVIYDPQAPLSSLVAQQADNTAINGAARGLGAVDFQISRPAANRVAGGNYSCTLYGQASASFATISLAGGDNNQSAAVAASALGGSTNLADGQYGAIFGGYNAICRGRYGQWAFGSGKFINQGDAQIGVQILRAAPSGTAAVRLTADSATAGAANVCNLPVSSAGSYTLRIVLDAFDLTNPANGYSWVMQIAKLYKTGAAQSTTTLSLGTAVTLATNSWAPTVSATADTTNGGLNLSFTPPAGNTDTIHVVARVESVEVQ